MISRCLTILAVLHLCPEALFAQASNDDARLRSLEDQLRLAQESLQGLSNTIDTLVVELAELRAGGQRASASTTALASDQRSMSDASYAERILVPDLGHDERGEELTPRPELFVQTRFHANPIDEAADSDAAVRNFGLNRVELRWAGRVSERIGMGYEIQHHPAPDGAAEELVNDAYVEYYATDSVTVRAGQFVKPFGFDIQHSSGDRESPERGVFAGYFFPGQRDRGLMLAADLSDLSQFTKGMSIYAGAFNGNRFFDDNNSALNYNLRLRKVFDSVPMALGVSLQRGTQILPTGVGGNDDEDLFGVDIQYVVGRLGIRAEYVRGNTPSTLLGIDPEFAGGFFPGSKSSGSTAFFNYNLTAQDDIYWRWDRFENDPVTQGNIRAFNIGYLRSLGLHSRIGIDYQRKSNVTFNDDELNNALSVTWNVSY
ncbi:MAG: OprO/OprP family phosphate-selective porin [Gammaproteobacteria bacterium]|nr:OprO/OprP family phosphate-selective porin [Gammaproteobacteria bacterium]